jgi:hypothetical protein
MMLTYRLVHLIEAHSDALALGLLHKVQRSEQTRGYRNVPPEELKQRVYEIYRHLGEWLLDKSEFEVERRYAEIGARRAEQHVPLPEVIWAIVLTKDNLWEFIIDESFPDRPVEIFGRQELLQLLDQFFDRAIHAAAVGYAQAAAVSRKSERAEVSVA